MQIVKYNFKKNEIIEYLHKYYFTSLSCLKLKIQNKKNNILINFNINN